MENRIPVSNGPTELLETLCGENLETAHGRDALLTLSRMSAHCTDEVMRDTLQLVELLSDEQEQEVVQLGHVHYYVRSLRLPVEDFDTLLAAYTRGKFRIYINT
ncbi:hypothetical protein BJV82DRAFT_593348 [Fennellomyces sp. T-0311]|nr:hypothetical protein BJV82DRAFT_593348 [Fennellomyces sp. T-0311]